MNSSRRVHAALIMIVAMWGLVFVAIARLLPQVDPIQLVTIRFVLNAGVFVAIFIVVPSTRPRISGWRDWGLFAVLGALAVPASQLPIVNGQHYLSPPLVSMVVTTSPAFAAIIAAIWLSEVVNSRQVIGFATAICGVAVVILAGSGDSSLTVSNPLAATSALASPVSWALYTVMSKRLTGRFPPITAVGVTMLTGSLLMLPLYPHAIDGISDITATGWGWMAYLVFGGTVIPYLVWWRALDKLTAVTTTAYMYAIPIAALFWSWRILDLVPSLAALSGGAVIICGVSLIQFSHRTVTSEPRELPA